MYAKFQKDLKASQPFVDWIAKKLRNAGWEVRLSNRAAFDIYAFRFETGKLHEITIECKCQHKLPLTGNHFIETKAIHDTQADLWATGVIGDAYLLKTQTAKQLYQRYPKKQGGDFEWNNGALVPHQAMLNEYHLAA
jgi:hypothetical protein